MIDNVEEKILETKEKLFEAKSVALEFYRIKYNLLNVYLMNYILVSECPSSPMKETLLKTTILLEKLLEVEDDLTRAVKRPVGEKRPITEEIMENNPLNKKKEQNNPRKKYKEKFNKMKETFEKEKEKKIDWNRKRLIKFIFNLQFSF